MGEVKENMTVDFSGTPAAAGARFREKLLFRAVRLAYNGGERDMNMIFTERELHIIRIWGDTVMHGGHWGDGDVIFPDEAILMQVIERAMPGEDTALTPRNLEILAIWSDTSTDTPEEQQLRQRIREAMK